MCWPTFRGLAYMASSIFIYRGIQVVFNIVSLLITGLKVTYLPISQAEEFLLQLIYFIPLFTSSSFALVGVESDSFNFVLFSTVALSLTLLLRYSLELAYIYLVNWESFRMKTTCLGLNIGLDFILVLVLLAYIHSRLRHQQKLQQEILILIEEQEKEEQRLLSVPKEKTATNNSQQSPQSPQSSLLLPTNETRRVGVGIGQGFGQGVAIHYPCSQPADLTRLERPLPPLPSSYKSSKSPSVISEDYESLPRTPLPLPPSLPLSPAPIATPDYDDL